LESTYIDIVIRFILRAINVSAIKVGDTLYQDQVWDKCSFGSLNEETAKFNSDVEHVGCGANKDGIIEDS
jgi:hypothetical protein